MANSDKPSDPSGEQDLVARAAQGNREAFEKLVEKYNRVIYAFSYRRLGNVENAKDATQEIFVRAFYCMKNLVHLDRFLNWLFGLANNVCCSYARKLQRTPELAEINFDQYSQTSDSLNRLSTVEENISSKLLRERVLEVIGELPENYQLPLMLRYLEEMTYGEIAETLDITRGAVVGILFRGTRYLRIKLRPFLEEDEG